MENTYLAIDLGGTFLKYAYIDKSGNIEFKDKIPSPRELSELIDILDSLLLNTDRYIKGIAVSCPGKIDQMGTIHFGGSLGYLHGFPLKEHVSNRYQTDCSVVNDGKAAALAELWLGNLKEVNNGIAMVLGTGVGGGIIIDGKILQGEHFQAGELSLILTGKNNRNSIDMLGFNGSAVEFIKKAANLLKLPDEYDGAEVFRHIMCDENEELNELFKQYCYGIAFQILNIQAILDFKRVVIGGGISEQPILIEEIRNQYILLKKRNHIMNAMMNPVEIMECKFHNEANLLGALYNMLLEVDQYSLESDRLGMSIH